MLQAYTQNSAGQALDAGALIALATTKTSLGTCTEHVAGSTAVTLKAAGTYRVEFNGIFTATGDVSVQLYSNTVAVADAVATASSTSATDYVNLSFVTFITVLPSCRAVNNTTSLTLKNISADTMYLANLVVSRVR